MRSQQVFRALEYIPNRFSLCRITSIAIKRLHKAHDRPQDTISSVLVEVDRYRSHRSQNRERTIVPGVAAVLPTAAFSAENIHQDPANLSIDSALVFAASRNESILEAGSIGYIGRD